MMDDNTNEKLDSLAGAGIERTVYDVCRYVTDKLTPLYGEGEAKAMAVIIFENLKGWTRTDMALKAGEHLTPFMLGKFDDVIAQLLKQKPIQYIFGNTWFYGMKLTVTPDTLIPRPETAEMVDFIVQENQRKDLRVIDLCTGSGCIAIALARNLPFATVTASDISAKALDVARGNARTLYADVRFVQSDLLTARGREALAGNYDIIVSNPPYIAEKEKAGMSANVLDYEPHSALFVPDSNPLEFYDAIFDFADGNLAAGGKIYLEINPLYADQLRKNAVARGFADVRVVRDSYGRNRFLFVAR